MEDSQKLAPVWKRNDKKANRLIIVFSIIVFGVIVALGKYKLTQIHLGFDPHIFAKANAYINSLVALLLIIALIAVKSKKYHLHKRCMILALGLSILFLISYICHNLFAGETHFGGTGTIKYVYFILLATHILLAAVMLPFILFTAYRGLTADYPKHKRLARITWPLWLYIAISGPIIYLLISPYYR